MFNSGKRIWKEIVARFNASTHFRKMYSGRQNEAKEKKRIENPSLCLCLPCTSPSSSLFFLFFSLIWNTSTFFDLLGAGCCPWFLLHPPFPLTPWVSPSLYSCWMSSAVVSSPEFRGFQGFSWAFHFFSRWYAHNCQAQLSVADDWFLDFFFPLLPDLPSPSLSS